MMATLMLSAAPSSGRSRTMMVEENFEHKTKRVSVPFCTYVILCCIWKEEVSTFKSFPLSDVCRGSPKEVLRNKIISEVKQSVVLQEDGFERMKLKDLSDAIFQDIGSKIMGQISDEVWNVIQSNETDIQGTVNAVYNRILNPEKVPEPSSKKLKQEGKEKQVLPTKTATTIAVKVEDDDPEEPPGFGFSNTQCNDIGATKPPMNSENGNEAKPNGGEAAAISNPGDEEDPEVPPGFG